jgi:UDP-GlcNAc:undecaprenyl-phosphate GlcNAc-1-phosphate transferase
MREYVLTILAAAAVTYLLTPLVRRFAIAIGAKHAARDRDVHVVPTPLLGGFAMYAGLAAGLVVASRLPALNSAFAETNMAKGLLLAGGVVVIMGFVDDRWGMGAISKLAGQVAAGVILVWSGASVTWLPEPGGNALLLTSGQQMGLTILVVVVTINAVNFIDGLDGLAAGIVGIGAAAFFIYYYTLIHRLGLPDQTGPALASAVLVGVCLGFLPHNFYPARIFMGDTGAMLIGLLLAYAPISSIASSDPSSLTNYASGGTVNRFGAFLPLLLPAAIMLIPYADLLMAVIRRTRAGLSVFAPDKKHLHHRMLAIGHSHRTSVLIMYLWAALFAGSVVWLSIVSTPLYVLAFVTVGAMLALLLVSMPRLRPWSRSGAAPVPGGPGGGPALHADIAAPAVARRRRAGAGTRRAASRGPAPAAAPGPARQPAHGPAPAGAAAPDPARVAPGRSAVPAGYPPPAVQPHPGSPWEPAPPTEAAFYPTPPAGAGSAPADGNAAAGSAAAGSRGKRRLSAPPWSPAPSAPATGVPPWAPAPSAPATGAPPWPPAPPPSWPSPPG